VARCGSGLAIEKTLTLVSEQPNVDDKLVGDVVVISRPLVDQRPKSVDSLLERLEISSAGGTMGRRLNS
jgi:hypothetical protein